MDRLSPPVRRLLLPAFLGYSLLAVLQTWPLTRHLSTHVTGIPGGDTGVYIWNTWVFRHELIEQHRWPFSTSMVLPLAGSASLGLHNYTAFADAISVPLQPLVGVIAAFNLTYLLGIVLAGLGLFLLAHHVTGRPLVSWIAGAMFASAPFLVARGTAHFSLAAAAPLPFFLYWFDRMWQRGRAIDAMLSGATVAWAAYCDPYYAIYCAALAVLVTGARVCTVSIAGRRAGGRGVRRILDAAIGIVVALAIVVHGVAGGELRAGPVGLSMHTLYTPMLLLAMLLTMRLLLTWRLDGGWHPMPSRLWVMAGVMAVTAAVLLAPELLALGQLAAEARFVRAPVLWRSSAPGADLLALLVPNPNHPLAPSALVEWVARQPGRFEENVLSISWVAIATILAARRAAGTSVRDLWLGITITFAWLALGPFVVVAGYQTYFPTPWTLLRYLPVIGDARMPQRFGVLIFLGLSMLFARALADLTRPDAARRRLILAVVGLGLVIELIPAPRPLYAASVPSIYRTIAADPRPVRVLELPFGIRDGLSSLGDFAPGSLLFQTVHHKPLLGGYLSRVDEHTKEIYLRDPVLSVLIAFGEKRQPAADDLARATAAGQEFARETNTGYVVIDRDRVWPETQRFVIDALRLRPVAHDGSLDLYAVPSVDRQ